MFQIFFFLSALRNLDLQKLPYFCQYLFYFIVFKVSIPNRLVHFTSHKHHDDLVFVWYFGFFGLQNLLQSVVLLFHDIEFIKRGLMKLSRRAMSDFGVLRRWKTWLSQVVSCLRGILGKLKIFSLNLSGNWFFKALIVVKHESRWCLNWTINSFLCLMTLDFFSYLYCFFLSLLGFQALRF